MKDLEAYMNDERIRLMIYSFLKPELVTVKFLRENAIKRAALAYSKTNSEELANSIYNYYLDHEIRTREEKYYNDLYDIKLYVNEEKKVVTAKHPNGDVYKATCTEGDEFNVEAGVAIALTKLIMGLSNNNFKEMCDNAIKLPKKKSNKEKKD